MGRAAEAVTAGQAAVHVGLAVSCTAAMAVLQPAHCCNVPEFSQGGSLQLCNCSAHTHIYIVVQ